MLKVANFSNFLFYLHLLCRYVLGAVETFLDAIPAAGIFKRKLLP